MNVISLLLIIQDQNIFAQSSFTTSSNAWFCFRRRNASKDFCKLVSILFCSCLLHSVAGGAPTFRDLPFSRLLSGRASLETPMGVIIGVTIRNFRVLTLRPRPLLPTTPIRSLLLDIETSRHCEHISGASHFLYLYLI